MSNIEKVDFVIFGATGYVGKIIVKDFTLMNANQYTWAIAGRNLQKLQDVLKWVSSNTGQDVTKIPIIISDCEDESSLDKMAQRARVLMNCCGPYRFYGEAVIKACIKNATHQVDICAEIEFGYMEKMQLKYNEEAEKKGVYIICACGLESVPWDFGVIHFVNNFPGQVNTIECFLKACTDPNEPLVNFGTWDSVVHGFGNLIKLDALREKLYSSLNPPKLKPRMNYRPIIHRCDLFDNNVTIPLFKSHQSTVFRTQMFLRNHYRHRPVQYYGYYVCKTFQQFLAMLMVAVFLILFSQFNLGRRLLLRYPKFFSCGISSKEGPSEQGNMNASICYKFRGKGWTKEVADRFENKEDIDVPPNKEMLTEFSFMDGYNFTSKAFIISAITILKDSDKMPPRGGVYSPGAAFYKTNFIQKLSDIGVSLKILKND